MRSHCTANLNLLFCDVLVAVGVVIAKGPFYLRWKVRCASVDMGTQQEKIGKNLEKSLKCRFLLSHDHIVSRSQFRKALCAS